MKLWVKIFFLGIACFLSLGCGNSGPGLIGSSSERQSIERVLKADKQTENGATSVAAVVSRMRSIDFSGCPNDFKAAYLAHIHAWESLAEVETAVQSFKSNNDTGAVMAESFIRGLLGDPFGKSNEIMEAQNQLERAAQNAGQQIKSTFNRIEEIAVLHGATLQGNN